LRFQLVDARACALFVERGFHDADVKAGRVAVHEVEDDDFHGQVVQAVFVLFVVFPFVEFRRENFVDEVEDLDLNRVDACVEHVHSCVEVVVFFCVGLQFRFFVVKEEVCYRAGAADHEHENHVRNELFRVVNVGVVQADFFSQHKFDLVIRVE
jgi:hypothetical protein